jgi:hypothetical protein
VYSTELYSDFIVKHIEGHNPEVPLFVYAAFQGIHFPLEVPRRFFDRYSAAAAAGGCRWEDQPVGKSGFPNGFKCAPNPRWPALGKVGLDCLCNRLLVKAQVLRSTSS